MYKNINTYTHNIYRRYIYVHMNLYIFIVYVNIYVKYICYMLYIYIYICIPTSASPLHKTVLESL